MCMSVCVCLYICMYECLCACMHNLHVFDYICICEYVFVYMHIYAFIYSSKFQFHCFTLNLKLSDKTKSWGVDCDKATLDVYIYRYISTYIYVYTCTYIYVSAARLRAPLFLLALSLIVLPSNQLHLRTKRYFYAVLWASMYPPLPFFSSLLPRLYALSVLTFCLIFRRLLPFTCLVVQFVVLPPPRVCMLMLTHTLSLCVTPPPSCVFTHISASMYIY